MPQQPEPAPVEAKALTDLTDEQLRELVTEHGGKPFQARQVAHWLYRHGAADFDGMNNVPRNLRAALGEALPARSTKVAGVDRASCGTEKLLLELADGQRVECVLIPEAPRMTLCISTQVGCPVGCVFCASGMLGVTRNLTAGEIVEQVLHARSRLPEDQPLTNLVVMGIGEPMLNLDALLPALERIHDAAGIGLGTRRITVSTSGYPRQMEQFASHERSYQLAVSLHAVEDGLRRELVPTARHPVAEILAAAGQFSSLTGREVTFEVVLLEGRNDRPQDATAMAEALRHLPCTVNLIPWNPVEELAEQQQLRRPSEARVDAFADILRRGQLNVTVRRQRGADQSAACGQLRLRDMQGQKPGQP